MLAFLIYRTWAIISTCLTLNSVHPVFLSFFLSFFFSHSFKSRIWTGISTKSSFFTLIPAKNGRKRDMGSDHGFAFMVVHFALTSHCICWNEQNTVMVLVFINTTSNNQKLRSAGDNDRRSKRFCSMAVLCLSFRWEMVKPRKIRLRLIESAKARDQSAFCAFHTFLVEVQTKSKPFPSSSMILKVLCTKMS